MKEAQIILPVKDNDGFDLDLVHKSLAASLCGRFGGCTVTVGHGSWINDAGVVVSEPVKVYTVAGTDVPSNNAYISKVATRHGKMARQDAVYWRDFFGNVTIFDLLEAPISEDVAA